MFLYIYTHYITFLIEQSSLYSRNHHKSANMSLNLLRHLGSNRFIHAPLNDGYCEYVSRVCILENLRTWTNSRGFKFRFYGNWSLYTIIKLFSRCAHFCGHLENANYAIKIQRENINVYRRSIVYSRGKSTVLFWLIVQKNE